MHPDAAGAPLIFDAIVLSGGASTRLGGVPKAEFTLGHTSLINITVAAVNSARQIIIVGSANGVAVTHNIFVTREHPPFSGPAAAIAAGLAELNRDSAPAPYVLVTACDMPGVGQAIAALLVSAQTIGDADGLLARDASGQDQYLVALYKTQSLKAAVDLNQSRLIGLSARALLASLSLLPVAVTGQATDDLDTWDDAARLGARPPAGSTATGTTATDNSEGPS